MALGGARPGSGRKKGIGLKYKRDISNYFTEAEVIEYISMLKERAVDDNKLLALVIEQLFGKAPQRMELTGADGEKLTIEISEVIAKKRNLNDTNERTDTNSS